MCNCSFTEGAIFFPPIQNFNFCPRHLQESLADISLADSVVKHPQHWNWILLDKQAVHDVRSRDWQISQADFCIATSAADPEKLAILRQGNFCSAARHMLQTLVHELLHIGRTIFFWHMALNNDKRQEKLSILNYQRYWDYFHFIISFISKYLNYSIYFRSFVKGLSGRKIQPMQM